MWPVLPLLFNMVLEFLAKAIREEKEKESKRKKTLNLSLLAGDRILCIENSEDNSRQLLELIN